MVQVIPAKAIALPDLKARTGLVEVRERHFFPEWRQDLPELDPWERQTLDRIRTGYFNLLDRQPLLETAVRMCVVHPLLFAASCYIAPPAAQPETSVAIAVDDGETTIEGRMDVLVLRDRLWLAVIEAKRVELSLEAGLGQLLAYLLGNPNAEHPVYGLLTNGGYFQFVKLMKTESPQYALSNVFALRRDDNELYPVLQILKKLVQLE